jgi:hypothetical protein
MNRMIAVLPPFVIKAKDSMDLLFWVNPKQLALIYRSVINLIIY